MIPLKEGPPAGIKGHAVPAENIVKDAQIAERFDDLKRTGDAASLKPATPAVHQGRLEGANFAPAEAAVRLIHVMRQFEMLQRAVTLGSEMNRKSVEDVARIGG